MDSEIKGLAILGIFALVMSLIVGSCDQQGEPVEPTMDRTGAPVTITVIIYPNHRILNEENPDLPAEVVGFSEWVKDDVIGRTPFCRIHVVKPMGLSDPDVKTWGHELLHCVYGKYHKEAIAE